jgi:hypothetical protein
VCSFEEENILKKIYEGIIKENVIYLKEKLELPVGTQALVTLKLFDKEEQEEIKDRQLKLLDKGFYLGKRLYSKREDLHVR